MIGIYSITNLINGKKYIGQSINIENRFVRHKCELRKNRHVNRHLQASWNKYGEKNFKFNIIETCTKESLNNRENYWINYYNTLNNGYNLDEGGNGISGYKHSKEEISKMRKSSNPLPILQFDLNFNFIAYYEGGVSHAAKQLNYTSDSIKKRCKHLCKKIGYKNSYWVYEEEYINENFSWNTYLSKKWSCTPIVKNTTNTFSRKICQYDLNRNLIKIWNSFTDIENAGFTRNQVNTICNKRKGKKTHKGFIWTYADYDFSDGYFDNLDIKFNRATENRKKPIIQYDLHGKILKTYSYITEAADELNIDCGCISTAIKNHTVCKSCLWSYLNDNWVSNEPNINQIVDKSTKYIPKKVIQLDSNFNPINTYLSTGEAARSLNIKSQGNIVRAIKNNTTCAGYHWKYA